MPGVSKGESHLIDAFWTTKGWRGRSRIRYESASNRLEQACEYYGSCGGCTHRHLSDQDRRNALIQQLRRVISRHDRPLAKIEWYGGAKRDGYRTRVVLRPFVDSDGQWHLRFGQTPTFDGVCVSECRAHTTALRSLVPKIIGAFSADERAYWPEATEGSIRYVIVETDGAVRNAKSRIIVSTHGVMKPTALKALALRLFACTGAEVYADALPKRNAGLYSNPVLMTPSQNLRHKAAACDFTVSPKSWWSQSPESVETLAEHAARLAQLSATDHVLEVGCGVGTLGVLLGHEVSNWLGIDRERSAILDAQKNARAIGDHYRFYVGDGEHWLRKLAGRTKVDVVFLHGMRAAFGQHFMRLLKTLSPRKVIYISPSPRALFEDLTGLLGYTLTEVGIIDNTPNSGHWLTMVSLTKTLEACRRTD